jgi:aspergillopepsin I
MNVQTKEGRSILTSEQSEGPKELGNTIKPIRQKTWFENIKGSLEVPLFALSLRKRGLSTIDFGFVNSTKMIGKMAWSTAPHPAIWTIICSAIRVQGESWNLTSQLTGNKLIGIVDSRDSMWRMPSDFLDFYYSFVPGVAYERNRKEWFFPCALKLPDIVVTIDSQDITIPGSNLKSELLETPTQCGGVLRALPREDSLSSFGLPFMQDLYIAFGKAEGYMPRLGVAQSSPL